MEIVRLGQGVDRTGRLAPEAIERTRVALRRLRRRDRAAGRGAGPDVRHLGHPGRRQRRRVPRPWSRDTLGVAPEVVTGDEEARLSFTGAVRGLPADAPPPYLVVDIGGGSTEFVWAPATAASRRRSRWTSAVSG